MEFHLQVQFVQSSREVSPEAGSYSGSVLGPVPLEKGIESCFDDESWIAALPYTMAELNHAVISNQLPIKRRPIILAGEEHCKSISSTPNLI
jgi:hypothetical protein